MGSRFRESCKMMRSIWVSQTCPVQLVRGRRRRHIGAGFYLALSLLATVSLVVVACAPAGATTVDELKSRITRAGSGLKDVTFTLNVTEKNADAIEKVDPNYSRVYEFKTARIYLKEPDKLRTEGKLGMVKFEYIINGGHKIIRAPLLKIRKESDYTGNPGKLNDALDFGVIVPSLWALRTMEIMDDAEAASRGETKVRLRWAEAAMSIVLWLDCKEMYLKRLERRDGNDQTKIVLTYTNHRKPDGAVWIPSRIEMLTPDGTKVGVSEITDIKINSGLADSLFK